MRIFLDANVLFSAAYSDSAVRRLLTDLQSVPHSLVADHYVLEEALRNLSMSWLHTSVTTLTIVPTRQPSDTVEAGCDSLMTGDSRHFSPLFGRTIGGVGHKTYDEQISLQLVKPLRTISERYLEGNRRLFAFHRLNRNLKTLFHRFRFHAHHQSGFLSQTPIRTQCFG